MRITYVYRYKIDGFQIYYNEAKYNKCDGVVVYKREDILANVLIKMIGVVTALECSFTFNNVSFIITGVYIPNPTNVPDFINNLDVYLRNIPKCDISLLGDMNIDLAQECEYNNLRYVNMLQQYGYVSQINIPTRVEANSSMVIDHIFLKANRFITSDSHLICNPILLDNCMTDHYPVLLNIEYSNKINRFLDRSNYLLKKIVETKLVNSLQAVNWNNIYSESDAEIANNKLQKCIDEVTSYVKITNNTRKLKPWMTAGILTSIRRRDKLKQYLKENNDDLLRQTYTSYRNKITNLIKTSKNNYYSQKFIEAGNNYRKSWDVINEITNNNNKTKKIDIKDVTFNSNRLSSPMDIANAFNRHFNDIGEQITSQISDNATLDSSVSDSHPINVAQSLFLTPVDSTEVQQVIYGLKNSASPGKDGILTKTKNDKHFY
nr:unnamed protein product [Callosobruchus analis]